MTLLLRKLPQSEVFVRTVSRRIIRITGHNRRSCLPQLVKLGLNFRPFFWLALGRIRRIRMCEEFQEFGPNRLAKRQLKFCFASASSSFACVSSLSRYFPGACYFTGIKIVVGQVRLAGAYLA